MIGRRIAVSLLGILLVLSTVGFVSGTQPYTSPGANQTYSLEWLADNTEAMDYNQEGDCYYLVDDITISATDTINFAAGEALYIYTDTKLLVNGNLNIYGESNDEVIITMSNGVKSDSLNLEWAYQSEDPNTFTINYLDWSHTNMKFTNSEGDSFYYEPEFGTLDSTPVYLPSSAMIVMNSVDYFALYKNAWTDVGSTCLYKDPDTDGDSMPNWWENQNGLNSGNPNDAGLDPDNDDLINLDEWIQKTDPQIPDSDGDTLDDGDEVWGNGGTHDYNSKPLWQHSDSDGLRDDYEVTINVPTGNEYETDPMEDDTDGDTLDDDDEIDDGTDPTDKDTDSDYLDDNRDYEPTKENRKFAFIFEINKYNGVTIDRSEKVDWLVANELDDLGWDVSFYTDFDYNEDVDEDNDLNPGVYDEDKVFAFCTFSKFEDAWKDFWDRDTSGTWNTNDVGKEPSGYGKDIVFIYIDGHGRTLGNRFELAFPPDQGPLNNYVPESSPSADNLEDTLNNLGDCIDIIWLQVPNSIGWNGDIGTGDDLGADDRILVYCDDDIDDDTDVFEEFMDNYEGSLNDGFETAFGDLTQGEADSHYYTDKYTEANPYTVYLHLR